MPTRRMTKIRPPAMAAALLLAACGAPEGVPGPGAGEAAAVEDAAALVRAMHARYADTWYRTLTFTQATVSHASDGSADTATWHEALRSPGRLRIDMGELADGNGVLFADDSLFSVQGGAVRARRPYLHPLLVLGFDVYTQPVERTLAQLDTLGYDLALLREDTWQGRPAWVVGAAPGDSTAVQFWVDRERLVVVRTILRAGADGSSVEDARFEAYEPLGDAWVAPRMRFLVDGRLSTEEIYTGIRRDADLPDRLFRPSPWRISEAYW